MLIVLFMKICVFRDKINDMFFIVCFMIFLFIIIGNIEDEYFFNCMY